MQIYLINLATRPDRLSAITAQFENFKLGFTRVDAVLGKALDPSTIARVHKPGPLGILSPGDLGCFLSHRKAWQLLIESGEDRALIMEDDVIFDSRLVSFIASCNQLKLDFDLIKIDRHGNSRHRVLLGKHTIAVADSTLRRLLSKHTGTGAYVISRACAQKALAASAPFQISVDHFLFNRNNSKFAQQVRAYQLQTAIVSQGLIDDDRGDIHSGRLAQRTYDYHYWKRELIRGLYEMSDAPAIAWNLIKGARFEKISFQP